MNLIRIIISKLNVFFLSTIIIGAIIIFSTPNSRIEIIDTNFKVGDKEIYLSGSLTCLDCAPTVHVLFEDKLFEVSVLKAGYDYSPPLIKRWFRYVSVIEAYEKGYINLKDIEESDSNLFIIHEKKVVKDIMSADKIVLTFKDISDFFYTAGTEEFILTGDSLQDIKDLFVDKEFIENNYMYYRGEIKYELKLYVENNLIDTIEIDLNGMIFELQMDIYNPWVGNRATVDIIDLELLNEILSNIE